MSIENDKQFIWMETVEKSDKSDVTSSTAAVASPYSEYFGTVLKYLIAIGNVVIFVWYFIYDLTIQQSELGTCSDVAYFIVIATEILLHWNGSWPGKISVRAMVLLALLVIIYFLYFITLYLVPIDIGFNLTFLFSQVSVVLLNEYECEGIKIISDIERINDVLITETTDYQAIVQSRIDRRQNTLKKLREVEDVAVIYIRRLKQSFLIQIILLTELFITSWVLSAHSVSRSAIFGTDSRLNFILNISIYSIIAECVLFRIARWNRQFAWLVDYKVESYAIIQIFGVVIDDNVMYALYIQATLAIYNYLFN